MNNRAKDNPNHTHPITPIRRLRLFRLPANRRHRAVFIILLVIAAVGTVGASSRMISREYMARLRQLSTDMVATAEQLRAANAHITVHVEDAHILLEQMKCLVEQYESTLAFADSPYPGEIYLGTTDAGDSRWLDLVPATRYAGYYREIRIRRTGYRANYLRINDIEITYHTRRGPVTEAFNVNGRVKLYGSGVFKLSLPHPMRIDRMRVRIDHESTGLEVYGIPYEGVVEDPRVPVEEYPGEVLLGTTPGGDSNWLETLLSGAAYPPFRQLRLRRTGSESSYIRIKEIEITYLAPHGTQTQVLNQLGRDKLYVNDAYTIALPHPMKVVRIRINIDHKSGGLEVYGIQ